MSRRFAIAALIYMMVNAVLFGVGAVTVLSVPSLSEDAKIWLPLVIAVSFILAAPLSWIIAPKLRLRRQKKYVAGLPADRFSSPLNKP